MTKIPLETTIAGAYRFLFMRILSILGTLWLPMLVAVALLVGMPLTLGLGPKDTVLLGLTFIVSTLTFSTGRTTVLQGVVHLVIFAAYIFLTIVP